MVIENTEFSKVDDEECVIDGRKDCGIVVDEQRNLRLPKSLSNTYSKIQPPCLEGTVITAVGADMGR